VNILYYIRIVLGGALPRGPTNDYEPSIEVIILNIIFQQNSFPRINKYHSSISTIKIMSTGVCDKKRSID